MTKAKRLERGSIPTACECGNDYQRGNFTMYDGMIGYEALICQRCARYVDHNGEHRADKWSRMIIGKSAKAIKDLLGKGVQ